MLSNADRFRTSSIELTYLGTSSSGQKNSFGSIGAQYGHRVVKAYAIRFKPPETVIR